MANRHRGEIEATLDGKAYRLCLTLGALAELEHAYGDADMLAIAERFEDGRLKADDAVKVIAAGLRGAGNNVTDDEVASMAVEGGAGGYVRVVADLLNATFAAPDPGGEPAKPDTPSDGRVRETPAGNGSAVAARASPGPT